MINSQPQAPVPGPTRAQAPEEILLNRYRVLERRGTGGFGAVCTCWDTHLQRRVAIKRVPIVSTNPDGIPASTAEEVLAEARTASLLAHPNIVGVHEFDTDAEYAYIIMEFVDGLNLAELLARVEGGRLTHEECAHVLTSCARALSFAHENRVLHMDIKPTNIMIDRMGTVKITDFGMAELGAAAGYGGARGGTVGYMPPEQIEGMLVDERADVFSLAVVLWQSLCGKNPFAAPSAAASLEKIRRGARIGSSKTDPDLGIDASDALTRALAPQASERTSSVDELACDLLPALGDPLQGQASLAELVQQSEEDDGTTEMEWGRRHLPLHVRLPQAWTVAERLAPALAVLACARTIAPAFAGASTELQVVTAIAAAALTALWPAAGSALVGAAAVVAVATTNPVSSSFVLALALGAALTAWWVRIGRTEGLATLALLAPWACGEPISGALVAGFTLDPLEALLSGGFSYLAGTVFAICAGAGFNAGAAANVVLTALAQPQTWISAVGCAAAAWISSLIAMRGSVASGIVGQALGLGALLATLSLGAGVENGGIWGSPDMGSCAFAVIWFMFMCVLTVLRGPLDEGQEGEGDELSQ